MIWLLSGVVLVSAALTWLLRSYALHRGMLDHPNQRSSHTVATPRGGGLAIVVAYLGVLGWGYLYGLIEAQLLCAFLVAGGLVAAIGYLDDHGHVPARWRILVHFMAAALALFWIGGLPPVPFGDYLLDTGWLRYPVAAVFLVWMLNLYNFMDGIDGIAGGEAVCVAGGAVAIYLLRSSSAPWDQGLPFLMLALIAACIGFLWWNWPPAKIFMGDVGSSFIGFVLGVFALIGSEAIGKLVVEHIGASPAVLLKQHGVFTIGATVEAAVKAAVMVEDVARTVWLAMQMGQPEEIPAEDVAKLHDRYTNVYGQ